MNVAEFNSLVDEFSGSGMDKVASKSDDLTSRAQSMIEELNSKNIKQASFGNVLDQMDMYMAKTADEIREGFGIESNRGVDIDADDIINCFMKGWE